MDTVNIARELWGRRRMVGVVAIVAIVCGLLVSFRVSVMPPKLESRSYDVGIATARMLVDTPNSQVVAVSQKGSETLGTRASLLSNLMTEGEVKADIARRVNLRPKQLVTTSEADVGSAEAAPPRKPGRNAQVLTTRVLTNTVGEQLPIIEVEAQARDTQHAAALARAAVASLTTSLDRRAASEAVVPKKRLRVTPLGPPEVQEAGRGTRPLLGFALALFLFGAGCGLVLLLSSFARGWREAEASESRFPRPYATPELKAGTPLLLLPGREEEPRSEARSS